MNRYYQMAVDGDVAHIDIYGDITSWEWLESDVSSYTLAKSLATLPETVSLIDVHINSYGGEVSEGLAIYNALKAHPAKVRTVVDGFACSIASVVFMAGDERVMSEASLLLIHNAWTSATGDSEALKKAAADLETITEMSKRIYRATGDVEEERLDALMNAETWLTAEECAEMGFCTEVEPLGETAAPAQSARMALMRSVMACPGQPAQADEPLSVTVDKAVEAMNALALVIGTSQHAEPAPVEPSQQSDPSPVDPEPAADPDAAAQDGDPDDAQPEQRAMPIAAFFELIAR